MFNFIKKLFRKEKREIVLPEHLSRENQKKVREIIKNAQKDDGVTIPIQSGNDVPNVNPVQDKTEPVKLTEDGKVDPTTIAKAEDFGDWEEETGCRG